MSSCSYVAPTPNRATAATRRKSTGSHSSHTSSSTASGSGSLVSAAGSRGSSLNASFRSDGGGDVIIPSSTLDRTAQSAVQRIAMQLMKYEAANGDTSDLSAMDRCGKMLKRKVRKRRPRVRERILHAFTPPHSPHGWRHLQLVCFFIVHITSKKVGRLSLRAPTSKTEKRACTLRVCVCV